MDYIHVRNLEKYHPGYKDRTLQWGKIFINMVEGDPDTELIDNEIDWARLIKLILLELRAQKPLPNFDGYWLKKGFNLKVRSMSLTLQMLHNFVDVVTVDSNERHVDKIRIDKKREDKDIVTSVTKPAPQKDIPENLEEVIEFMKNPQAATDFWDYYASNGWKIGGRAPMKDWRAAGRRWMRKNAVAAAKPQKSGIKNCFICQKNVSEDFWHTHLKQHEAERNNQQTDHRPGSLIKMLADQKGA